MLTQDDIDYYTCGWCWSLAWHLHRLSDYPMVLLTSFPGDPWNHVVVKVARGKYLDVHGVRTRADLVNEWGNRFKMVPPRFKMVPPQPSRRQFQRDILQWGYLRDYRPSRTIKVAKMLLESVNG